ncbi:MAG: pyruvate:ferredoxin (flavodoxin) oxidoreductase [Pseudomonadales bacterium]
MSRRVALDGNGAVAHVAYRTNEVCAIYPITPASPMAELADQWSAEGVENVFGQIPQVQELQSEGGAAGTLHGALQGGALTTTFTASQGLLLMIPNMYKIAGELTATVFHVAARSVATQALSIFGDHSDVMAARATGFAILAAGSVQEAHDLALVAQAATLESRVPFLHCFDGFRTSHEVNVVELLSDEQIRGMIEPDLVRAHRRRALSPEHPVVRGTAHNPDTFFQAREAASPFYAAAPGVVAAVMDRFAGCTGRRYGLFDFSGAMDAERVVVLIGSGAETARQTAAWLCGRGERVGVLQVRLYRPFSAAHFLAALPESVRAVAVLDRTKEPGAPGEPLYLDVVTALAEAVADGRRETMPAVIGGRYGLSSKEFTPAMVKAVFDELAAPAPRRGFTVGIDDDVSHTSLVVSPGFRLEPDGEYRAQFFGLGSDGTVGANKNSVKIVAEHGDSYAQGYFVYDSHKSGAQTVSHLRFAPSPIRAPYLVESAHFVACHQFQFLGRVDVLRWAAPGATFLLNSPYPAAKVWPYLPQSVRRRIVELGLDLHVIDAARIAREHGLGPHVNTILQACFFALAGVMDSESAMVEIKAAIERSYRPKGGAVVRRNLAAVDAALSALVRVPVPDEAGPGRGDVALVPDHAPEFVRTFTAQLMAGRGDEIPVSRLPVDGSYPSGTAAWEKRNISESVPQWQPDLCIQCGQCSFVCPHAVIRARHLPERALDGAPDSFQSRPVTARGFPDVHFTLGFYVEDCTGCGLCVEVCPAHSPEAPETKALNMADKAPLLDDARANLAFFASLPVNDRSRVDFANVNGVQFLEPLFEFSGACGGCGETPYLRLISQLFGDRLQIANATGCSSIYGGNLPVTPWSRNHEGRGPAWSNSLFEDNAEFGLGFRIAADRQRALAESLLRGLAPEVGETLAGETLDASQVRESEIRAQRGRVAQLQDRLQALDGEAARDLLSVLDYLVHRSVWIVGGDGWAYDIGFGGLDHVLAQNADVNILVLDTEVYSNTGGQASKATPLGAIAKFAAAGKRTQRKDLALQAIAYGHVYVAQVSLGANPQQTLVALREAEAYRGPSLVLAYSPCIAHGFDLRFTARQQDLAVACGHWPLFRYNPAMNAVDRSPFLLDSPRPTLPFREYAYNELRYRQLAASRPEDAERLLGQAQTAIDAKYRLYERMAAGGAERVSVPSGAAAGDLP